MSRLKTHYMVYNYDCPPGVEHIKNKAVTWVPDIAIRIFGVLLRTSAHPKVNLSPGRVCVYGEVSTAEEKHLDGMLIECFNRLECKDAVIGNHATEVAILGGHNYSQVWFPLEGCVDIDAGAELYIHFRAANSMNHAHEANTGAVIYYARRCCE